MCQGICLVQILGIGKKRLARVEAGAPDLRCGAQPRGSTAESYSVRAFFHTAYTKLGECLPDKFVRRGRAKVKKKIGNDTDSESGGVVSCPDGADSDDELREWLDRSTNTEVHNAVLNAGAMAKRWLPPGNLSELFDHYQVVQALLEVKAASFLVRMWRDLWCQASVTCVPAQIVICESDVCVSSCEVHYFRPSLPEGVEACSWVPAPNRVPLLKTLTSQAVKLFQQSCHNAFASLI